MKIDARIERHGATLGPEPWDEEWGITLPLDHVICHDVDGTPHTVGEFVWPWTAYHSQAKSTLLHFFYWNRASGRRVADASGITPEREGRIRELQFLMTRQIYYGNGSAPRTLYHYLFTLFYLARFAEAQSCKVRDVLMQTALLDVFEASLPDHLIESWIHWFNLLSQLDPETQLGITVAIPIRRKDLAQRAKALRNRRRQYAPLPTRIYADLINNLSAELDDIEAHKPRILAAMREAITMYRKAEAANKSRSSIGHSIIKKYELAAYLERLGYSKFTRVKTLMGAFGAVFRVCQLQIHLFSGMRRAEATHLPYHCMANEKGLHGRTHCLIVGTTTKLNHGRRLRTKWITTERDGFRAIRLAQEFAEVIYDAIGITPSKADDLKDNYPLFPSTEHLPWAKRDRLPGGHIATFDTHVTQGGDSLLSRLCPIIEDGDIDELEEIDPFRVWREEPEFAIGQRWPLTTHQLRRSLAVYANASGLVRISSLRRQLQHLTREMSLYYGRGSTFCKNFIADDPPGYKKHVAVDWQDGADEADMLAFTRDVLNSTEPMFGGAGHFYERQRERGEVMSRDEVTKQMKAGLLAYRDGPLGGCTRPGVCETRKGLNLIDTVCATDGCKHLIGKHSKIVQTIRLKRVAMMHITPGSITEAMEKEELDALERVEREWRPIDGALMASTGGRHA